MYTIRARSGHRCCLTGHAATRHLIYILISASFALHSAIDRFDLAKPNWPSALLLSRLFLFPVTLDIEAFFARKC